MFLPLRSPLQSSIIHFASYKFMVFKNMVNHSLTLKWSFTHNHPTPHLLFSCYNSHKYEANAFKWLDNSFKTIIQEKALMMPISQTQDPHRSFKVSYPSTRIVSIWSIWFQQNARFSWPYLSGLTAFLG